MGREKSRSDELRTQASQEVKNCNKLSGHTLPVITEESDVPLSKRIEAICADRRHNAQRAEGSDVIPS